MNFKYDPMLMMNVPIKAQDASRGHEIVVKTENYLKSIGKNNSVGKYDKVVMGVKSLLEQGFLEGPELERAIKQQADRLLKKYSLDEAPEEIAEGMTHDGEVLQSKGGYTLGVNNSGKLVIAFRGETLENPHMYLGEATNKENMRKAVQMFEDLVKGKAKDSKTIDEDTLRSAIRSCDAGGVHILFYRDIDGNKKAEKFTDIGKMRSRADELVAHGINSKKMKEWTHAEWAEGKYNELYNKYMGMI